MKEMNGSVFIGTVLVLNLNFDPIIKFPLCLFSRQGMLHVFMTSDWAAGAWSTMITRWSAADWLERT